MKLVFEKKEEDISVKVNGEAFTSDNYIEMIKNINDGVQIEAEFSGDGVSSEEQESVKSMLEKLNGIVSGSDVSGQCQNLEGEEVKNEGEGDLPF